MSGTDRTRPEQDGSMREGAGQVRGDGPSDAAGSAPARVLAGLVREVEALRRQVRALAGLPARVEQLDATVAQAIDDLAGARKGSGPARPVSWLIDPAADSTGEAGDPELAARRLGELTEWVGRVYLRYPSAGRDLPGCWLWHPDLVEELTWLHQAWLIAYHPETGSVAAVGDWHDRYRPGVEKRIRAAARTCSLHEHLAADRPDGHSVAPSIGSVQAVAVWWSAHRDRQPPVPTAADMEQADRRLKERRR